MAQEKAPLTTAFVDVAIIPMDRERILERQTVLVVGTRIAAIGPVDRIVVPSAARRVDGRGKYLIPGLADMHAHVPGSMRLVWGGLARHQKPFGVAGVLEAEHILRLNLFNGVTTVRLMLGSPETRALQRQAAEGALLPTVHTSSPSLYAESPDSAAMLVERAKREGYDFVKLYTQGEAWDRAVAAAKRVGIPIAGHIPGLPDAPGHETALLRAVEAGYRSVEHIDAFYSYLTPDSLRSTWKTEDLSPSDLARRPIDSAKLASIASAMRRRGVWHTPTLILMRRLLGKIDPDTVHTRPEFRYLTDSMRSNILKGRSLQPADVWPVGPRLIASAAWPVPDRAPEHDWFSTVLTELHRAGVGLLLGTDAMVYLVPGFAVHRELLALVQAGLRPYDALATSTRNVAAFFGTEETTGTVAVAKRADLVLLRGNPLEDIRYTAYPEGVMLGGRWMDRAALDAGLAAIEGRVDN